MCVGSDHPSAAPSPSSRTSRPSTFSHLLPGMVSVFLHPSHSPDLVAVSHVWPPCGYESCEFCLIMCVCALADSSAPHRKQCRGRRAGLLDVRPTGSHLPVIFTPLAQEDPPCGSPWKVCQLFLYVELQFLEFYEI